MKKSLLAAVLVSSFALSHVVPTLALDLGDTVGTTSESESEETSETESEEESVEEVEEEDQFDVVGALEESLGAESIEVVYEFEEPIVVYEDDLVRYQFNGYTLYEVTNVDRGWEIIFGDQRERGGILAANITYENKGDEPLVIGQSSNYEILETDRFWGNTNQLIPEEEYLGSQLYEMDSIIQPGEEVTGYEIVALSDTALDQAIANGEINYMPSFMHPGEEADAAQDILPRQLLIVLPLSDEAAQKVSEAGNFYPDKASQQNLGKKTMLEEVEVGETQTVEDIDITVNGYQIVEFEPNAEEAASYDSFRDGVVLVTVEYTIENNSSEDEDKVNASNTSGSLILNQNTGLSMDYSLTPDPEPFDLVISEGDSHTGYMTFALSMDDYELYKDRSLHLEVNIYDAEYQMINEYQGLIFTLKAAE